MDIIKIAKNSLSSYIKQNINNLYWSIIKYSSALNIYICANNVDYCDDIYVCSGKNTIEYNKKINGIYKSKNLIFKSCYVDKYVDGKNYGDNMIIQNGYVFDFRTLIEPQEELYIFK
jgi:hypothetical protein